MREFYLMRKMVRLNTLRRQGEPDTMRTTTKRKRMTGSYSDFVNLPSGGGMNLNGGASDPSGMIQFMLDYDSLP
jgi:hypothetical protein